MIVVDYLQTLGPLGPYLAIISFLVLTGAGLPVPEEVPIVAAGVLAFGGHLDPWAALASCLIGALLGDSVVYAAGRFLGRSFFRRHKWFALLLDENREEQMEELIRRHGFKAFFIARFMIGVRAPIYLAAGVMRVSWTRFILIDGIAATVVVGIVFGLSYFYGEQIKWLVHDFSIAVTAVAVLVVLTVILIFLMRRRRLAAVVDPQATEPNNESTPPVSKPTLSENRKSDHNGQAGRPNSNSSATSADSSRSSRTVA